MQLLSWFSIDGSSRDPAIGKGVIAQFYFPTNSSELDSSDRGVLSLCAAHLRQILQRERVELAIIGHADHRGNTAYNKALGTRRAQSVASEFNRQLGGSKNFTSFSALSQGERYAAQGTTDQLAMAQDRRVDVWSTTAKGYSFQELPALDSTPRALRPVVRVFREFEGPQAEANVPDSPAFDALTFGIDQFVDWVKGGQTVIDLREIKGAAEYREIDATHRVNVVKIHATTETDHAMGSGVYSGWDTKVTYIWGVAQPMVTVQLTDVQKWFGGPPKTTVSTKVLSRKEADANPFYFPTVE